MTDERPVSETPLVPPTPVFPEKPASTGARVLLGWCAGVHAVIVLLMFFYIRQQYHTYLWPYFWNGTDAQGVQRVLATAFGVCNVIIPLLMMIGHGILAVGLAYQTRWAWLGSLILPPTVIIGEIGGFGLIEYDSRPLTIIPLLVIYLLGYLVSITLLMQHRVREAVRDKVNHA
jgi:hypothetical protein